MAIGIGLTNQTVPTPHSLNVVFYLLRVVQGSFLDGIQ